MLYLIQGPTASGKTNLAIELALHLNTEIISADSRQFYQEMNIGTAKPTMQELKQVRHHFIDNRSLTNPMNVADFEHEAKLILDQLLATKGSAVITGGSAQFIDALVHGLDPIPVFPEIQLTLRNQLKEKGINEIQVLLKNQDLEAFESIDVHNSRRLIRALEVKLGSGKSILQFQKNSKILRYPFKRFVIVWDRQILYNRINERVDQMLQEGLEEEVRSLQEFMSLPVLNTVGYKEWIPYFNQTSSKADVVSKIKQNTRNYAKRQQTWLNKYKDQYPLNPNADISLFDQILNYVNEGNIPK